MSQPYQTGSGLGGYNAYSQHYSSPTGHGGAPASDPTMAYGNYSYPAASQRSQLLQGPGSVSAPAATMQQKHEYGYYGGAVQQQQPPPPHTLQQLPQRSVYNDPHRDDGSAPSPHQHAPPSSPQSQDQRCIPPPQQQQQQQQAAQMSAGPQGSESLTTKRHPRPIPNRKVDVLVSPTPARMLLNGRIPKEFYNSSVGPWTREGSSTSPATTPIAALGFIGIDDGNANPKFVRLAEGSSFSNDMQLKDSGIPFGAILSPLYRPLHEKEGVPVIHDRPPVRCHRCRGYMSCHVRFIDGGRRWRCPLCEMINDVEEGDFANLDSKGRRVDRLEKPELCFGSVEYIVDQFSDYSLKSDKDEIIPTRPLHHLFLVDVSVAALHSFLPSYVYALEAAIAEMAKNTPQCRVSFITYASQLHFYNLHDPSRPQYCVPDVDNPFVPLPHALLGWLEAGRDEEVIAAFLRSLPAVARDLEETECALGAAVQAALLVFAGQHGGRVVMCGHRYPQRGVGAITPRQQHLLYGTPKEKEIFRPIEGFWTTKALEAAKQQVSFDLFMFSSEYCELVTLSQVCHITNGKVHLFQHFDAQLDYHKLAALLREVTTEEAGYAGLLRVRCSSGLRVKRYRGHYLSQTVNDMDLASITSSSAFFVEFAHEGALEKNSYAFFQVALLYTTRGGSRRVRVHNLRVVVAAHLPDVFASADLEATLFGYVHEIIAEALNKGTKAGCQLLRERIAGMLIGYRRFVSTQTSRRALLMPSRLHLIVIFGTCLLKSEALSEGTTTSVDARMRSMYDLISMPTHRLLNYLYPTLYPLHTLRTDRACGLMNEATGLCNMPQRLQLVYNSVTNDGVYVLCDEAATMVYLWIGAEVDPEVSEELFGSPDAQLAGRPGGATVDDFSERVRTILYALTYPDGGIPRRLVVLHQGDVGEDVFFTLMKEERQGLTGEGYDESLQFYFGEVLKSIS